jgi:hypothetical protein
VVEVTYLFAKPARLQEFVWQYAKTTRQEILSNRRNIGERLGFLGRVVHGKAIGFSVWWQDRVHSSTHSLQFMCYFSVRIVAGTAFRC